MVERVEPTREGGRARHREAPGRQWHHQAGSGRRADQGTGFGLEVGVERNDPHELKRLVVHAGANGECIPGPADPDQNASIGPFGHRRERPVRALLGDHGAQLWTSIGKLDTGLDPVFGRGANEQARLVELLRERGRELDLHGAVVGQRSEQCMLAVVDEPVRGETPGVAAFDGGDQ